MFKLHLTCWAMIFAGAFYTVTLCGQNLLTSQTTWQAPANKNISSGFDGETFTLKTSRYGNFQGFESNAIHLKPGKYVFEADFCTDGQAAARGGAMAEAVGGKAKRPVPPQIQLSNGKWQHFRHVFHFDDKDAEIKIRMGVRNFRGTLKFRNPKLIIHTPFVLLKQNFSEKTVVRINIEPKQTYKVKLSGNSKARIDFIDQKLEKYHSVDCADGTIFTVPEHLMISNFIIDGPGAVEITEIPEALSKFDWKFWNSHHIYGATSGGSTSKEITLDKLPDYAIVRMFMVANLYVNGQYAGSGNRGYNDEYYCNITDLLKVGKNKLVVVFPEKKDPVREIFALDMEMRFADGSRKVILTSQADWINKDHDGKISIANTFVPHWLTPMLFERNWVTPSGIPDRILPVVPVKVKTELASEKVQAGKPLTGKLSITFEKQPFFQHNRVLLQLKDTQGKKVWRQLIYTKQDLSKLLAGDTLTLPFEFATYFVPAGKYTLHLAERFGSKKIADFSVYGEYTETRKSAKFKRVGSADVLDVDGELLTPLIYYSTPFFNPRYSANTEEDYRKFADSGYKLFNIVNVFGYDIVKNNIPERGSVWKGIGQYDFTMVDEYAEKLFSVVPDAKIVYFFDCSIPTWWIKQFPEEAVKLNDGSQGQLAAFSSKKFRADLTKALEDAMKYLASKPWSKRIVAFYAACGYDGQWFEPIEYRGVNNRYCDYSVHMENKFRSFLRKKYNKDVKLLREAWGNEKVDFDNAPIPTREERNGKTYYLDPVKERNVIDYLYCVSEQRDEVIDMLGATIKKTLGDIPFGTYYIPYDVTYRIGQAQRPSSDGIYDYKNYNYAAAPLGYDLHDLHQPGTGSFFALEQTQRLHDVFFIGEDDTRTYLSMQESAGNRNGAMITYNTLAGMRRNASIKLVHGQGFWYFDMYGHWFEAPALQALFRWERSIMECLKNYSMLPELSAKAVQVLKVGTSLHKRCNSMADLYQVHFPTKTVIPTAFALDSVNLRDLDHQNLPKYKVYIFDDTFALEADELKKIEALKKDGNILVFTHAAGYSNGKTLSAENISKLTGINIVEASPGKDLSPMNWIADGNNSVLGKLGNRLFRHNQAKRFNVKDDKAVILGNYADDKSAAAAYKDHGSWKAIYLPAAFPHNDILTEISKFAKVHVFTDSPVNMRVLGRLISLYCPVKEAKGKLRLPGKFAVCEAFSGKVFPATDSVDFEMIKGESRLYFLGTEKEVAEFAKIPEYIPSVKK